MTLHPQTEVALKPMAERMLLALQAAFAGAEIQVVDDSAKHAGHAGARAGGESHFTVRIASPSFVGQSRLDRHRAVNAVLEPFFAEGLHALAIDAREK